MGINNILEKLEKNKNDIIKEKILSISGCSTLEEAYNLGYRIKPTPKIIEDKQNGDYKITCECELEIVIEDNGVNLIDKYK